MQKGGTGSGTVSGGGISCGATCSASLASGTAVALTAAADADSAFASWSGCDSWTGATCNVTMNASRTVTATFTGTPVQYTLTVQKSGTGTGTVSGGGISCGATCSASLASGTAVTLTAVADAGSTFASWSGCDSINGTTCNVTMNASRSVTATFNRVQYTLTVAKGGTGTGTVTGGGGAISCGATCSAPFDSGTAVTLTAAADPGSAFVSWSGCDTTSGPICNLMINASRTATATFSPLYMLTVQKGGTGTGTVSGGGISCGAACSTSLVSGTAVALTPVADAGSTFGTWTGCDSVSGTTCNVTMNANRTVNATFTLNTVQYTLTVQKSGAGTGAVSGGGINCGATCSASLAAGAAVTLTAVPDPGSAFGSWSGCDPPTGATCNVTMNANRTVNATFTLSQGTGSLEVVNSTSYTISDLYVSPAGAGRWGLNQLVSPIAPSGTFTSTPIPAGLYDFLAVASDGYSHWLATSISITAGGLFTWTLLPPDTGSLAVVNNYCLAVTELYLAPSGSPAWSPNQVVPPLGPMGTFTLTGIPVGTYDAYALGIDGTYWAINGIPITIGGTFTWGLYMPAGTGCLTVVNNTPTGDTIDLLYDPPSSPSCPNNTNWGTEQLGGVVILPGASFTLGNVSPGAHDLRASGFTALGDPSNYVACGAGIQGGGTVTWYLGGPP
ncbi:MAG TPA: hypothetical protein VFR85_12570 [Anaeromyxobacteraceae bacterium]|nr:hypothetical protein [Anaeromyxobacteraceae bacterium]